MMDRHALWFAQLSPERQAAVKQRHSECARLRRANLTPEERERRRALARANYRNSIDKHTARQRRTYLANRERFAQRSRKQRDAHPGYDAVHHWIRTQRGAPRVCDLCRTESAKRYDWANVDHQYRRVVSDWMRLCRDCHVRYDRAKRASNAA